MNNLAKKFEENRIQLDIVTLTIAELAVDDFIIVSFQMGEQVFKSRRFIGRILKIEGETLTVKFLTSKQTKKDNGYIYTYPNVDDITDVQLQVTRKLTQPKTVLRGALQFDVDVKNL